MIELRRSPRTNVTWRAAVKAPDGHLVFARVINISAEGVLMLSPEQLPVLRDRNMMIEIPAINDFHETFKVSCRATIRHAILSGDIYKIGAYLKEISSLHQELVSAWLSKTRLELH